MQEILDLFKEKQDDEYAIFQAKLAPSIPPESCLGVRMPDVRNIAKVVAKSPLREKFIKEIPHKYYDENMLHSILVCQNKDFGSTMKELDAFLPYVDNWAVCDTMPPKVFAKHKGEVAVKVKEWLGSDKTFIVRFGIVTLIDFFLEDDVFKTEYIDMVVNIKSDDYYVKMAIAWFMATALTKEWDAAFPYIKEKRLDRWLQNKSIQKAIESYRITDEQKEVLRSYKI